MSRRLHAALAQLYRPSDGRPRTVVALCRRDAEKLPPLQTTAVISITAPGRPPAVLREFGRLLRLSFEDVDFLATNLSERAASRVEHCFTAQDALTIWRFVDDLPAEIHSIVIHCEGGHSRSCAIALALHDCYGLTADPQQLTKANPSIYKLMLTTKRNAACPSHALVNIEKPD